MTYEEFLATKDFAQHACGIADPPPLSEKLFLFQRDITRWALRKGRAAIFADCGMGKTLMQLEWARQVSEHADGRVLLLAPLAVAQQTVKEGADKLGLSVEYARDGAATSARLTITNYEMLGRFDPSAFVGIVLDESSILKSYTGATRTAIIEAFGRTPYRLACTATPAPNDYMELGNHAEFLGVMRRTEMLSMFFVHDGGETQTWRLKGHAESAFWRWVASWAVMLRKPSDLGYADGGFALPPLRQHVSIVDAGESDAVERGLLFPLPASTLAERRLARKASIGERIRQVADMVNGSREPWVVWCNLNAEGDVLTEAIPDAVQVAGADDLETKTERMLGFAGGQHRVMVSKPSIAGHGMNWQHCPNVAFAGLSDSYEEFYQAVRRCWRFGQTRPVDVHVVVSETEQAVLSNIQRKERDAAEMAEGMVRHMAEITKGEIHGTTRDVTPYERDEATGDGWAMYLGDCVDVLCEMDSESVDFTIYSPPFASLYTYSAADRDMGNVRTHSEFFEHFGFIVGELLRVTKPGRLMSVHCMNLPTSKVRDGVIGLTDFRGQLIEAFRAAGWIYHSEVVIWKDPVTAMQRTKALGLLHKQLKKDSAMSRQGVPDYLVTMRKPGENPEPVSHTNETFPVERWQRYASPVWMDINPSDTLQRTSAREEADERHIAPLQLEVIRRALELWTNPGDLVLSPFAGIGSEGYEAIKAGRRFVGVELKRSYWTQGTANLAAAARERDSFRQLSLTSKPEAEPAPVG